MRYRTIVADPPWDYGGAPYVSPVGGRNKTRLETVLPYPSLSVAEVEALPISDLAAEDCRVFCWATNRHLPFAFGVIAAWGFEYRQLLVWHKTNATPLGSVAPNRAEFLLVGVKGQPAVMSRFPDVVLSAYRGRHSQKPELFMDYIEQVSPGPYLELFARRNRFGWDTWGNEALEHLSVPLPTAYEEGVK